MGNILFCKIGITSNIKNRLKQIDANAPSKPTLYSYHKTSSRQAAREMELNFIEEFNIGYHSHREWYHYDKRLTKFFDFMEAK